MIKNEFLADQKHVQLIRDPSSGKEKDHYIVI